MELNCLGIDLGDNTEYFADNGIMASNDKNY